MTEFFYFGQGYLNHNSAHDAILKRNVDKWVFISGYVAFQAMDFLPWRASCCIKQSAVWMLDRYNLWSKSLYMKYVVKEGNSIWKDKQITFCKFIQNPLVLRFCSIRVVVLTHVKTQFASFQDCVNIISEIFWYGPWLRVLLLHIPVVQSVCIYISWTEL